MRKVEVKLNEDKIKSEGKYTLGKIYEVLDEGFVKYADMQKKLETDGTVVYFAPVMKDENHYAKIMKAVSDYVEKKWFVDNAVRFIYGDTYGSDDPNDYSIEDILEIWEVGKSA